MRSLLGEFLGTLVLVLLGDGVVAGVLLKRSKAEGSGWIVITAGWAFAVMTGVFTAIACGSSDAHLNPAVTLGFAVSSGNYEKVLPYFGAQLLGAFAGATLVWLHFLPHWKETTDRMRSGAASVRHRRSGVPQRICLAKSSRPWCSSLSSLRCSQRRQAGWPSAWDRSSLLY